MHNRQLLQRRPQGFTLVEVLTVIIIIGILMGMLFVAFGGAQSFANSAKLKGDETQLIQAIENFRTQQSGNEYFPDGTNSQDLQRFVHAVFPRYALPANSANWPAPLASLNPSTSLVFWLGGYQVNGKFIGFSADPTNPFDPNATSRIGPFFDFDKTRLINVPNTVMFQYYPPNNKPLPTSSPAPAGSYSPYIYYKAVGSSYAATAQCWKDPNGAPINPFISYIPNSTTITAPVNPTSYQLLCPGSDGNYSSLDSKTSKYQQTTGTPPTPPLYPGGTNYEPAVLDDIVNFSNGVTLKNDMPN